MDDVARLLFQAWQSGRPPSPVTEQAPNLDEEGAYHIQAEYVRLRLQQDGVAGFKVGATSDAIRQALGLDAPLTGVLMTSGAATSGADVDFASFGKLLVETELAFQAGRVIDEPLHGERALTEAFPTVSPVFELAETGFYGASPSTGLDMIAANSACAGFVLGQTHDVSALDPDQQTVVLQHDGEQRYEARSNQTFGSQWRALEWLANRMIAQGYRIEPGHIFLTGALGQPQPGKPGHYHADYGPLGSVTFQLS